MKLRNIWDKAFPYSNAVNMYFSTKVRCLECVLRNTSYLSSFTSRSVRNVEVCLRLR